MKSRMNRTSRSVVRILQRGTDNFYYETTEANKKFDNNDNNQRILLFFGPIQEFQKESWLYLSTVPLTLSVSLER
jgi:hypothetical protein